MKLISYEDMKAVADSNPLLLSIKTVKAIRDMPESVVRCKDCVYRGKIFCRMVHEYGNSLIDFATDNGFCNNGKRE